MITIIEVLLATALSIAPTLNAARQAIVPTTYAQVVERPLVTEEDQWRIFLYSQLVQRGFNEDDYALLHSIIKCESGWRQYWSDGSVVVSKTNDTGLGQINRYAHEKTYTAMGLDPRDPYDNLLYVIYLYQRNGVRDWHPYSGHCWDPKGRYLSAK